MIITLIDKETLNIKQWVDLGNDTFEKYAEYYTDVGVIEGKYTSDKHFITVVNGVYVVNEIPPPTLSEKLPEYKANINSLAGEKILSVYPDYKQRNMTARYIELLTLNQLDSAEALGLKASWNWINDIRRRSNVASIGIDNASNEADCLTIVDNFSQEIANL